VATTAPAMNSELRSFLETSDLIPPGAPFESRELTGGVSSDIHLVVTERESLVVKRALAQLKVEGTWLAPVERSAHEAAYLRIANQLDPGFCPKVLAHDPASGFLAMEYLEPESYPLWKAQLLTGLVSVEFAGAVGHHIGRIHAAAASRPQLANEFETTEEFRALRIHPYLETLKSRHPTLGDDIDVLIEMILDNRNTLVHGDVSPKNILNGPSGPVLLDAECAWWGDPAFDVAFCMNHLFLKSFLDGAPTGDLMKSVLAMRDRYLPHVDWEAPESVIERTSALLPALMLARVDGLSPVEYFNDQQKDVVRGFALDLVGGDRLTIDVIIRSRLDRQP